MACKPASSLWTLRTCKSSCQQEVFGIWALEKKSGWKFRPFCLSFVRLRLLQKISWFYETFLLCLLVNGIPKQSAFVGFIKANENFLCGEKSNILKFCLLNLHFSIMSLKTFFPSLPALKESFCESSQNERHSPRNEWLFQAARKKVLSTTECSIIKVINIFSKSSILSKDHQ